jgi:hypothetical protein
LQVPGSDLAKTWNIISISIVSYTNPIKEKKPNSKANRISYCKRMIPLEKWEPRKQEKKICLIEKTTNTWSVLMRCMLFHLRWRKIKFQQRQPWLCEIPPLKKLWDMRVSSIEGIDFRQMWEKLKPQLVQRFKVLSNWLHMEDWSSETAGL